MAIIRGWRLIRQTSNGVFYFNCTTGQVEYSPRRKYRIEKKNAFDPTILHQRDEYEYSDGIEPPVRSFRATYSDMRATLPD